MVHVTDVKRTTMMEQVADDYEQLGKQGRFSKKCIPRGYIPDLNWATIHEDSDQPIRPVKQDEDPTETKLPPYSKDNRNAIHPQWTHWNAIQFKQRSMKCKLHQKFIL